MPTSIQRESEAVAIAAFRNGEFSSIRQTASAYGLAPDTLRRRLRGQPSRQQRIVNSRNFSIAEEEVIIERILDMDTRGWPPTYSYVDEIANVLAA
jgi:lambda repressor-like predicted transcriptional regulator